MFSGEVENVAGAGDGAGAGAGAGAAVAGVLLLLLLMLPLLLLNPSSFEVLCALTLVHSINSRIQKAPRLLSPFPVLQRDQITVLY